MRTAVRRYLSVFSALALAMLAIPAVSVPTAPVANAAVGLPSGFVDDTLWSGFPGTPTAIAFAPDGKVFVSLKGGQIYEFDSLSDPTPTLVIDLSNDVYNYWDRGLLGLAVDPGWDSGNRYIYALYSYDHIPGTAANLVPAWNDTCSDPTGNGCTTSSRLLKIQIDTDGQSVLGTNVLLDDWCMQFPSHSIGTLAFDANGALLVSGGDGASFNDNINYPSDAPNNPCGDPNPGTLNFEGGALRAQSIRRTDGPTSLDGTIIRIDRNGNPWPTNANIGASDPNAQRIIGYGMRNPFRLTVRPNGQIWFGDVGYNTWEEIDKIANPDAAPKNFGWPCYEANDANAYYQSAPIPPLCSPLPAQTAPVFAYQHGATMVSGDGCRTNNGSSTSGVAFLPSTSPYPSSYRNGLFFADYSRKCIWFAPASSSSDPNFGNMSLFANLYNNGGGAVYVGVTPAGNIIYADYDRKEIHQIRYVGSGAPTASFIASPSAGLSPLTVHFDGSGSSDPTGQSLTYAWDFTNDGSYDASGVTASHTYSGNGQYTAKLKVTDTDGNTNTTTRIIKVGQTPPVVTWPDPPTGTTWSVGDVLHFDATATDLQDGPEPASAFTWTIIMRHCPSACHSHVLIDGTQSGSPGYHVTSLDFTAPAHSYPSHLEVVLTVTDSDGLMTTLTRDFDPNIGTVTVLSSPPGIPIAENGTPGTKTAMVNDFVHVAAPLSYKMWTATYAFDQWSDGAPVDPESLSVVRDVTVNEGSQVIYGDYKLQSVTDAPSSCSSASTATPVNTWFPGFIGTGSDVDWYRFKVTSSRYYRIMLANLPVGATMSLYKDCTQLLGTSNRPGTLTEEIVKKLSPGTYGIRVSGLGTGDTSDPYSMRIMPMATTVSNLGTRGRIDDSGNLILTGEVWNGTTSTRGPVTVTAKLYDATGKLLKTVTGQTETYIPAGDRVGYKIITPEPAGYAKGVISLSSSVYGRSLGTITFVSGNSFVDGDHIHVTGTVKANSSLKSLRISLELYDEWGYVVDLQRATIGSSTLSKGRTTTYDVQSLYAGFTTPDTVRVRGYGFLQ